MSEFEEKNTAAAVNDPKAKSEGKVSGKDEKSDKVMLGKMMQQERKETQVMIKDVR